MAKPTLVSDAIAAWNLPYKFLAGCIVDAEATPRTSDFDFHTYCHKSGHEVCVAVLDNEILMVTVEESENGGWVNMRSHALSISEADAKKYRRYIKKSRE